MGRHRAANRNNIHEPRIRRVGNPDHIPRHLAYDHDDEATAIIVLLEPSGNVNSVSETSE